MITYVRLQHFRSYTDGSFEFDAGVNIVVGPNASGKTTVIEAVLVGLNGKSFKAADRELLATGQEWARIDIGSEDSARVVKLVQTGEKATKTFEIDDKQYKRLPREKTIPTVLFEPNHLFLFHGSPELRRSFLDDLLSQIIPNYGTTLTHYKRVLTQRNALLKQPGTPSNDQLFVWNLRLSELAGKIVTERQAIIAKFNDELSTLYSEISGAKTHIELTYTTPIQTQSYETGLLTALEKNIERDSTLGFTSRGPHREDVVMHINGKEAGEVASRGEIRTMVLALKMLEAQFLESARNTRPILLFDDVFSELDGKRRQALVAFLKPYQSLITTTDADVVIEHFTGQAKLIALS
jgi:DNA replication and repair protein RecF